MLRSEDILMQRNLGECVPVAFINLLLSRGVKAPSVGEVQAAAQAVRKAQGEMRATCGASELLSPGLTPVEVFGLINATNAFFAMLGHVPPALWHRPEALHKFFLDAGCQLLLFFSARLTCEGESEMLPHVVIAEGHTPEGYAVIDGEGPFEGEPMLLELVDPSPEWLADKARWMHLRPHGARRVLPFCKVTPDLMGDPGLSASFVVVFPGGFRDDKEAGRFCDALSTASEVLAETLRGLRP